MDVEVRLTGRMQRLRLASPILACLLCLALFVVAMAADASVARAASGFQIESYSLSATEEGGAPDTQAGSHPHTLSAEAVLAHEASNPADEVKAMSIELPPGLIVDPLVVPHETLAGEAQIEAGGSSVSAPLETLAPQAGELGALGFKLGGVPVRIGVAIAEEGSRASGDGGYRMTLDIHDLPAVADIESLKLVIDRAAPSIVTLPTSCTAAPQSTLQAESWGSDLASQSSSLPQMSGCGEPPFAPTLSVFPEVFQASEPSGYTLSLQVPQSQLASGPATAQMQSASILLPAGVSVSLSATHGLEGCTEAQVALATAQPAQCPGAARLGDVEIKTPLLSEPLRGDIFLATPEANPFGSLVSVYVAAEAPSSGTVIKLAGEMLLNPSTGQAALRFEDMPQLPIGEIRLRLFGGPRALLSNPPTCGPATSTAALAPWSGQAAAMPSSSFVVSEGANGAPCASPAPFEPKVRVEPTSVPAGATSALLLSLSRGPGQQDLSRFDVQLPAGAAWNPAGVQACGEPAASEGSCPAASRIGTAILRVGAFPEPASFTGAVYLTEGYLGAPSGLSIALDATAGPLHLGEAVVQAGVGDASNGPLTITSGPLPQILDGIPLQSSALEFEIERHGLILYPSACQARQILTTVQSIEGVSAQATTPFTVEGCQAAPAPPTVAPAPTAPAVASTASPSTGKKGDARHARRMASRHAISHIHDRIASGRLLLRFTTSTRGRIRIAGRAVHSYTERLGRGRHRVQLKLTAFGRRAIRRHRRLELRLILRSHGRRLRIRGWIVRPGPRHSPRHTHSPQGGNDAFHGSGSREP